MTANHSIYTFNTEFEVNGKWYETDKEKAQLLRKYHDKEHNQTCSVIFNLGLMTGSIREKAS